MPATILVNSVNIQPPQRQIGLRLLKLREQRGYSQIALARALGLSASYLNQIERNKRPLTPAVQARLRDVLGDVSDLFDVDEPGALQEALGETLRDLGLDDVSSTELRAMAGNLPQVSRALDEAAYRRTWKPVYEWLHCKMVETELEAAWHFRAAVGQAA